MALRIGFSSLAGARSALTAGQQQLSRVHPRFARSVSSSPNAKYTLVMMRHGQSRFDSCGLDDVYIADQVLCTAATVSFVPSSHYFAPHTRSWNLSNRFTGWVDGASQQQTGERQDSSSSP